MARPVSKLLTVVAVVGGLLAGTSTAGAAPAVDGVFPVSGLETNNKIVAGPDGNMWATLSVGKDVARISPAGEVQEFELEGVEGARGIAPASDGDLWVASTGKVTKFSPADPENTDQTFPLNSINNEGQIVAGPDGLMWVASNESLIHFDTADPEGSAASVPVNGAISPKDIDVSGSLLAVADVVAPRIATFTAAGVQKDYALAGGPQGVAGTPGGQIGFSQQGVEPEEVGVITPPAEPQGMQIGGDPFGVAFGPDGAFWIARSAAGELIRLTTSGQITTLGGFPPKYFPRQIAPGPNGTLWVTIEIPSEASTAVARISGVELPSPPAPPIPILGIQRPIPQTVFGKAPRKVVKTRTKLAKVKFRFSSASAGATFRCALTKLRGTKAKPPVFRACASPRLYRLRPGRYRFEVAAVSAGVVDPTPAVAKFRVVRVHR